MDSLRTVPFSPRRNSLLLPTSPDFIFRSVHCPLSSFFLIPPAIPPRPNSYVPLKIARSLFYTPEWKQPNSAPFSLPFRLGPCPDTSLSPLPLPFSFYRLLIYLPEPSLTQESVTCSSSVRTNIGGTTRQLSIPFLHIPYLTARPELSVCRIFPAPLRLIPPCSKHCPLSA